MKKSISNKILREFGILVGIGIPLIVGWIFSVLGGHSFRYWTLWISLPLLFLATFRPALLYFPYEIWMKLGHVLGWVNSKVILGLVFLIILQPIALIMKFLGYDPLRKKNLNKTTYREIRPNFEIDLRKIF